MTYTDDDQATIRVVPGVAYEPLRKPAPVAKRSTAQDRIDEILKDVEDHLTSSRDDLAYAVENMRILMTPQHQNIELLIGQLIEQTIEFKRMHQ